MPEFESKINDIFNAGQLRSEKLISLLSTPDDLISLVPRGHLVLEELLFTACSAYCQDPSHLKAGRLRFPQLVSLLRALEKISSVPQEYWDALIELNSLRNALAHQLEQKDIEAKISRFVGIVTNFRPEGSLPKSQSARESLESSLYFLIGGFEVVAVWHKAIEELIKQRAFESKD